MIDTPFLMTADLELYLHLSCSGTFQIKICTAARSESPLALNLSFCWPIIFHNRPTPYDANFKNIFFHVTMIGLNANRCNCWFCPWSVPQMLKCHSQRLPASGTVTVGRPVFGRPYSPYSLSFLPFVGSIPQGVD